MPKYYLASDVHVCKVRGAAVFLDLRSNSYMSVPPESTFELDENVAGFVEIGSAAPPERYERTRSESVILSLVSRGILTESRVSGKVASRVSNQFTQGIAPGLGKRLDRRIRMRSVAHFCSSTAYVSTHLHLKRVLSIVRRTCWLRDRSLQSASPACPATVLDALDSFRQLRTWTYTAHGACLFDSFVLTFFLHHYNVLPTFVIGIRTKPFIAHAWVQVGDTVLDERVEALKSLTPILVV